MARIRTVKPEFWTDDKVGEASVSARLLFIATWNFADDHGGLERSAKQLKAQAFPYDQFDCEPLVQELLKLGLLVEYEAGGKKYLHIKGFRVHQKIDHPSNPRVPLYEDSAISREDSRSKGLEGILNPSDARVPARTAGAHARETRGLVRVGEHPVLQGLKQ